MSRAHVANRITNHKKRLKKQPGDDTHQRMGTERNRDNDRLKTALRWRVQNLKDTEEGTVFHSLEMEKEGVGLGLVQFL